MARIAGVDLPRDKRVEIGLTYIYGIGRKTATDIIAATGVNPDTRVRDLTEEDVSKLREYIDKYFQLVEVKKIREAVAEAETKKEDSNSQSSTQSSQDGVNKEIWDFFIERQMFKTENRRSNIWKLH